MESGRAQTTSALESASDFCAYLQRHASTFRDGSPAKKLTQVGNFLKLLDVQTSNSILMTTRGEQVARGNLDYLLPPFPNTACWFLPSADSLTRISTRISTMDSSLTVSVHVTAPEYNSQVEGPTVGAPSSRSAPREY